MSVRPLGVLLAAGIALLSVGSGAAGPAAAPAAQLFISPSGEDDRRCTRAAPCESFERAYRVARPGQVVQMAAGHYGGQQVIPQDPAKRSPKDVVFRAAPRARVTLDSLDVFGDHVTIQGVSVSRDLYIKCGADDVTFRNSHAGIFFITSASNVRLVRSEFGPYENNHSNIQSEPGGGCAKTSRNVLMDRVYMHDNYTKPLNSKHMECLTITTVDGLIIRNSRFYHCEDFDILFKRIGDAANHRNILIENTWFDHPHPDGTYAFSFSEPGSGGSYTNVLVRNNSFGASIAVKPDVSYSNVRFYGNVGPRGPCNGKVEFAYNVWRDNTCGSTDRRAPLGYRNKDRFDFHLVPGAPAVNRGHPRSFPRTDIDGQRRPKGGRADAGADELG